MLAFYGWTDILLTNLVNTKINCFADENADLFVLNLDRVSRKFVGEIEKKGVFKNVFWITRPAFHKDIGPLTFPQKVIKLFFGERYYRCYKAQLEQYCGNQSYDILFTGAFWSETLFLFRYFRRNQPNIRIHIVEEGTTNYSSPPGWQYQCMPTTKGREKLMRCIYYPFTWKKARASVSKMHLYSTEITRNDTTIAAEKLPPIDKANPICLDLLLRVESDSDASEYDKRSIYFISGSIIDGYENTFDETYRIIDSILQVAPKEKLLIKAHPAQASGTQSFAAQYEPEVYVDRRSFVFESIICEKDLSNKLFIARNSSVPLLMKTQLGKSNSAIYTYKLYDFYSKKGESTMDVTSKDMLTLYSPEKFCAPNTLEELEVQLKHWLSNGKFISASLQ